MNFAAAIPQTRDVPGSIVTYSPPKSELYIGSPGLAVLPGGVLIAKCDIFGPASSERQSGLTRVFVSWDAGTSWEPRADVHDMYWASIFVHRDALYLLGTHCEYGSVIISKSDDQGLTWTEPSQSVIRAGSYHCAPVPVLEHDGRLWRAFEHRDPASGWADNFRALIMSAPSNGDLLNPDSWSNNQALSRDPLWNDGDFGGWLEGNVVVAPDGEILDVLRIHVEGSNDKAAIVHAGQSGTEASFDPGSDIIDFPGGATKFTIRFDPVTGLYWSLVNAIPPSYKRPNPTKVRNTLALTSSPDLRTWSVSSAVLFHPDQAAHGFQYVDWLFSGEDIIFLCRTAYDDGRGGARNQHDANFLTFHRLPQFRHRSLTDVPLNLTRINGSTIFKPGNSEEVLS